MATPSESVVPVGVLLDSSDDLLDLFVMALTPELSARVDGQQLFATQSLRLSSSELDTKTSDLAALCDVHDAAALERELGELFAAAAAEPPRAHVLSRRAFQRLRTDPHISGDALAQKLRSGPSGLSRSFHEDVGVRFVEYRSRLRLMAFVRRVDQGESLTQAALAADFGSYAQCHRVFRRALGCTPKDYFSGARALVNASKF